MAKVFIATEKPFSVEARDAMVKLIKEAGLEPVVLEKYTERAEMLKTAADCEGIIIRSDKVKMDVLEASPKMKICVRAGAGTDNVDKDVKAKIVVENTPGQNSNAVAELSFGMMVMMARGQYDGKPGSELKGKKLGLHAFGAVGKCMAAIAKGFGMEVCAFDPYLAKDVFEKEGIVQITDVNELYKTCDYVSLHIPKTEETIKSINYEKMSLMKETAMIVNTARAEVVNEEDMMKILGERPNFRYATDVKGADWDKIVEKFPKQVFATPKKMGAQTAEANMGAGLAAAEQVIAYLKDGKVMFQVK